SPRAVCTAGKNAARYRLDGKTVDIPGPALFADSGHGMTVEGLGALEAYPNRDSLGYIETYGLEGIRTMFRGTFRYPGWCETLKKVVDLGLLDETPTIYEAGTTYAQFVGRLLGNGSSGNIRNDVATHLDLEPSSPVLDRFEWLGLFADDEIAITGTETTPLDILARRMEERMQFRKGERDMIVLCHDFRAEFPTAPREHTTSTLIDFGQADGDSSMARTVSLPAAVGTKLILSGDVMVPGVNIPVSSAIYHPVLDELANMGIECVEKTELVD
ncbi:MAG: saccharopine dehydrogenase C-terminal domain-containing protein, partial [Phycisphaerae bacterium]